MNAPRPLTVDGFKEPNRDFGILPFWFLNGELDPDEMRYQLKELREKGMQGVVFHGRYGLEMPYLGDTYLERIVMGVEEANRLGLASWIYDEMNWPSGTADKRVLKQRPDLAQRYLECVWFEIQGPWFMCLTGEDSRYLDFERSTPVAVFAIDEDDKVIDLTANLSFKKVVPWEVPPGKWRLCYVVEKRADYYIDALDPESTKTFLEVGYDPYVAALGNGHPGNGDRSLIGFYSDEPAMHYFLTAQDNPIVPWTKDMFARFMERNGYDLRSRLIDLFFDVNPDAARTRHDFYNTTTAFYSDAYYRQLRDWCREHGVVLTAHLLYEEWLRQMVRVEGNPFRHYENMDVVAVDHLYPVIGTREAPDQHVAMKLASSAAHHVGSEQLICESFGGIFMDATMQRMKWITDWEYVLGVNVLNPHGFHYTFEGARKRDWPPSMFYQYPWWDYYGEFSAYVSRLSEVLTGGKHVAKVAVLWPINSMFANYIPHVRTEDSDLIESGLNVLTDVLLRLHHDYDYLDEDVLSRAEIANGKLSVGDEDYELVLVPPMTHIRTSSVEALERFTQAGGKVLGVVRAPTTGFGDDGLVDVEERIAALLDGFVEANASAVTSPPGRDRDRFTQSLDEAIRNLISPDIEITNEEIFALHRNKDGRDVYFLANTSFDAQDATVTVPVGENLAVWDPTTGDSWAPPGAQESDGRVSFDVTLPPVGSMFVVTGSEAPGSPPAYLNGTRKVVAALDGDWTFSPATDNGLVIRSWRATPEDDGAAPEKYAGRDVDDSMWQPVVAGAWAYQLPVEPGRDWPIPVWYRIAFEADDVPERLALLIDGFDADERDVWLNGERITSTAVRSRIDAQMQELDLSGAVITGANVLAVRLVLRDATGGLVDNVKLLGSFALDGDEESGRRMVSPGESAQPESWTEQGYPFFSGTGVYRTTFDAPENTAGMHLEVPMRDDVLEVRINGERVAVRLWDPYVVDVAGSLRPGTNEIELRVANTPANVLNGNPRPSGLAGTPTLVTFEGTDA